eukprot:310453-Alexandrium_andersonii.AAC.1
MSACMACIAPSHWVCSNGNKRVPEGTGGHHWVSHVGARSHKLADSDNGEDSYKQASSEN